ncbi:hypothetical protein DFH08DRAFT_979537 [Mycena albidolilacea]|uniref:Uncharacterized protein n=1 Tax=Mycena albidolilacea TaxID=1033008 RepID=A0AAD6YWR2_9AGAR|nr:hypothetical protein DFH08DRAFT_979586 [Mycena albidolilacea]KAJ7300597.1 hypothetical protein DFH08DRAFT_979537 [Mycena albidolilacea]
MAFKRFITLITKIKKAEIKLTDITDAIRPQFKTKFTPRLLGHAGRLQGWADPSDQDVISIWNRTFPDYALSTSDLQDKEMVLVVTKLAQDKVDTWRNKIGNRGIVAWLAVFHKQLTEEIATDVAFFLDGTDQLRNFYYCEIIEPEDEEEADQIQAGTPGNFSKNNWTDRVDFSQGVPQRIPNTSAIANVVKKLKSSHWTKIIDAARTAAAAAKHRDEAAEPAAIDVDAEPIEEDFDLVDNDSDA